MTETTSVPGSGASTAAATPAAEVAQSDDKVTITHPDVEGTATVSVEQFEQVYEPRGWELVDGAGAEPVDPASVNRDEVITVRHGETGRMKTVRRGELLDRLQARGWSEVAGTAESTTTGGTTGTTGAPTSTATTTGGSTTGSTDPAPAGDSGAPTLSEPATPTTSTRTPRPTT